MISGGGQSAMGALMGFELVAAIEGEAVLQAEPSSSVYNPIGTVHGGFAATLLDSACGCAVHSTLTAGQTYTTLELKVSYHKGMSASTGPVRVVGRIKSIGRRVGFAEAQLHDATGRLLASATSTLLVIDRAQSPRGLAEA